MSICIHKKLIGSNLHLIKDEEGFRWVSDIPDTSWLCGFSESHPKSIDTLLQATGRKIRITPSESHTTMWKLLRENGSDGIPWHLSLGRDRFQTHLEQLLYQIQNLLDSYNDSYYTNEFVTIRQFLQGLDRCSVDVKSVSNVLSDSTKRDGSLSSFLPERDGFLSRPTYSQVASCSGRLTVTNGPAILTLRKDRRQFLRSTRKHGSIVQVDFVSLEPRVALSVSGKDSPSDIYEHIRKNVLDSRVSRKIAKIATIGSLYGMSSRKLSEIVGISKASEARDVLKKIRRYFKIEHIENELNRSLSIDGFIKSHYGRAMNVDDTSRHVLVNRFIQSTATDAALLGFKALVEKIRESGINANPVFVIHDALVLDVEKCEVDLLKEFIKDPISLPGLIGGFPISLETIS